MRIAILLLAFTTTLTTAAPVPDAASRFREHGLADPPAKQDGTIRLATYNIHDMFDHADDPTLLGRRDDKARAMPENRQNATADALTRLYADIVALQEVESLEALLWYRDTHLAGLGYTHAASIDVGHAIGLEQAVISRFPILETKTWTEMQIGVHPPKYRGRPNRYAGQPLNFRRSPLMVELDLTGHAATAEPATPVPAEIPEADRLTLLVVHFKTGQDSQHWRMAETSGLIKIIAEIRAARPDRRVVILGDFGVEQGEGHVRPLLEAGFTDAFAQPESKPDAKPDEIATGIDGRRDCLILLDPGAAPLARDTPRFVLGTVVPPSQLERTVAFNMPGFASDHYPVAVDLAFPAE